MVEDVAFVRGGMSGVNELAVAYYVASSQRKGKGKGEKYKEAMAWQPGGLKI
jgi:hypothetical protein